VGRPTRGSREGVPAQSEVGVGLGPSLAALLEAELTDREAGVLLHGLHHHSSRHAVPGGRRVRPSHDARPPPVTSLLGSQRRRFRSCFAGGSSNPRCRLVVAGVVHAVEAVAQVRASRSPLDADEHPCSDAARRKGLELPTARSVAWWRPET
jgi:hypothetical protein